MSTGGSIGGWTSGPASSFDSADSVAVSGAVSASGSPASAAGTSVSVSGSPTRVDSAVAANESGFDPDPSSLDDAATSPPAWSAGSIGPSASAALARAASTRFATRTAASAVVRASACSS